MGKTWRIILDTPQDAYYNMAKDEALLLYYKKNHIPVFRIYSWDIPSVSLGYRQKAENVLDIAACKKLKIPFVRRITGGGAILHHKEITYSLVCSTDDLDFPRSVKKSYKILNSFLINFYNKLGLKARFVCDIYENIKSNPNDFCFMGFEPFDIIIEGKKVGGNAQRRSREIIFQHGSIPFDIDYKVASSLFKDVLHLERGNFPLKNIPDEEKDYKVLGKKLANAFAETFNVCFKDAPLTDGENVILKGLLYSKYSNKTWNLNSGAYNSTSAVIRV